MTNPHDDVVHQARTAAATLTRGEVARAFTASLTTRRLDWRSALGSWAAMQHLPAHAFVPSRLNAGRPCAVCGARQDRAPDPAQLDRLRTEQHRLVRFQDVAYAGHDLATFRALEPAAPTDADRAALKALLDGLRSLGPDARIADLDGAIRKAFRSNKAQRKYVLEALAIAGILRTPEVPGYEERWVGFDERECELSAKHFYARDSAYPLQHWHGGGVDEEAVQRWFGEVLRDG